MIVKNKLSIKVMGVENELLVEQNCGMWKVADGMLFIYEDKEYGTEIIGIPLGNIKYVRSKPIQE